MQKSSPINHWIRLCLLCLNTRKPVAQQCAALLARVSSVKREQIGGGRGTGKRKREIGRGSGWLTAVTSNKQRAGQAPEGDISLQLCRDLLLFTVLCATAGPHFTLANGFSLDRQPRL